jgi:hypothetical protein
VRCVVCAFACCVRVQAWATGWNANGRLGLGDTTDRSTPVQLLSPTNIVQVAAGGSHTVLLDGSGLVRASCLSCLSLGRREPERVLPLCVRTGFAGGVLRFTRGVLGCGGESVAGWGRQLAPHRCDHLRCALAADNAR